MRNWDETRLGEGAELPIEQRPTVNGLPLPDLLISLIQHKRWVHPGDERIRELIPFFGEPVDLLQSVESMQRESSGFLADDPTMSTLFHEVRGSKANGRVELPWLDVEFAVFVAVNRFPGDDIGIALDYRTDSNDPRVVANDWGMDRGCIWREVTPSFSTFIQSLRL
jgi:hypothetical protein